MFGEQYWEHLKAIARMKLPWIKFLTTLLDKIVRLLDTTAPVIGCRGLKYIQALQGCSDGVTSVVFYLGVASFILNGWGDWSTDIPYKTLHLSRFSEL